MVHNSVKIEGLSVEDKIKDWHYNIFPFKFQMISVF